MDDGSRRSYMEKSLAAELNLSPSGKEILSQGLFGGEITHAAEHGRFTVTVEGLDRKYSTTVSLLDQQKICSTLPRIRDESLLADLASRGIKLTDVGKDTPPIRVLLGADVLGSILTGRIEVFSSGVSAVETLLGWTILGLGRKKPVVNMVTLNLPSIELPRIRDIETDEIYCVGAQFDLVGSKVVRKGKLLSVVSSTYDPGVSVPGPPAPNPVAVVSRPVKQTRCGRRIVPGQRLNL
ncbi:transposable element Tc1 transposase [Trichonephila clavata]|uniref:Transposable element Tc1 transposase n=1 Tax=Trichonephila clavata TaxID=2740835 RepID=A0A8X6EXY3_TRICU|nr:transposable element Tc1 transposase [Trichonephila clavata]